jgi:predicted AAA+ superfamily ATPase
LLEQLHQVPVKAFAHQTLMDAFHRYAIIGGMPEVIKTDVPKHSLSDLRVIYESIWGTYKNDVEKYTSNDTERKIIKHLMVLPSVPGRTHQVSGFRKFQLPVKRGRRSIQNP